MPVLRKHRLIEIEWPEFGGAGERPAQASADELRQRIERTRSAMDRRGLTHLAVYADREHFANLRYLTNFDPRFEEALLVLTKDRAPLVLVGNECADYLPISPLYNDGGLRRELFQPFSLLDQPRGESRMLAEIFAGEGIGPHASVGCVGWKYFSKAEHPAGERALDIPSFLADSLRALAGIERVVNATSLFMSAADGLRATCSASEIAWLEYSNVLSSEAVRRILLGMKEGLTDHDLVRLAQYDGTPLCCYLNVKTGKGSVPLSSSRGDRVERGNRLSCNVGHWGSNICRSGWVAAFATDLAAPARDYVPAFAGPYVEALAEWLALLDIGVPGGVFAELIARRLPAERFGIKLNPGHLIHMDEWLSSPMYAGSEIGLRSGMAIQVDVIPSSPVYGSTRMEDGVVLADAELRRELQTRYPRAWARCQARRKFMAGTLGLDLSEAVLPLSNIPSLVPPFFLKPGQVLALER